MEREIFHLAVKSVIWGERKENCLQEGQISTKTKWYLRPHTSVSQHCKKSDPLSANETRLGHDVW